MAVGRSKKAACVDVLSTDENKTTTNLDLESQIWKTEHSWIQDSHKCFCGRGGYEETRWPDCEIVCDCNYGSLIVKTCDVKRKCKCVNDNYAGPHCDQLVCRDAADNTTLLCKRDLFFGKCGEEYMNWNRTVDDFDECKCGIGGRMNELGKCECEEGFTGILCEWPSFRLPFTMPDWLRTRYPLPEPGHDSPWDVTLPPRPQPPRYTESYSSSDHSSEGMSVGAIIAITFGVGLAVFLPLIIVCCFICCQDDKKTRRKRVRDDMILAAALDETGHPLPLYEYGTPGFRFKQPPGSPAIFEPPPLIPPPPPPPPPFAGPTFDGAPPPPPPPIGGGPPLDAQMLVQGGNSGSLRTAASARELASPVKSSKSLSNRGTPSAQTKSKAAVLAGGSKKTNVAKVIVSKKI